VAQAVLWETRSWALAIGELPSPGPLPMRCVLVPAESTAHALRRELVRAGRQELLAGTRFASPAALAEELLRAEGLEFAPGEDAVRGLRVLALLRAGIDLRHFPLGLLRAAPGWDIAFARTIGELESAGLRPANLENEGSPDQVLDVARLWRALDELAGRSWSRSRVLAEAADLLERKPDSWCYGPTLAVMSGHERVVHARFVQAIPNVRLALHGQRPLRTAFLERVQLLYGAPARESLAASQQPAPAEGPTERELAAAYVFAPPERLAAPDRARSAGPDGTLVLEEHAGVEAEIEAAADWVAREILERGTPLSEIALLVPTLDPLAALLWQRLRRLPWEDGELPVHVASGLPYAGTAAGARALALVRALQAHLSLESVAEILPLFRPAIDAATHLSRDQAIGLASTLGTVGGNPARPTGALEWAARARARAQELQVHVTEPRSREQAELAASLAAVEPALHALVDVARLVIECKGLREVLSALTNFLDSWLLAPDGPPPGALLASVLGPLAPHCATLAGEDTLRIIEETLLRLRVPAARFGEPAIYIGTVQQAAGLPFRSVRVLGLCEGALPSQPREDPVVPESLRAGLRGLEGSELHALSQLHALGSVVRNASARVVFSAPRTDANRVQREPAFIFVEAFAALGREGMPTVPESKTLRREAFQPARADADRFRLTTPVAASAWLARAARCRDGVPPSWLKGAAVDLTHLRTLALDEGWHALDGVLGDDGKLPLVPGLTPERPISASRLRDLLHCPHLFFFRHVLGWDQPAAPPSQGAIDSLPYGSLFHAVAERFFREHGAAFSQREKDLAQWQAIAADVARNAFLEFQGSYPLAGEAVRRQQLERLLRDVAALLEYDWDGGRPRAFVAVERQFGQHTPVPLALEGREVLHVCGFIDRLDVEGARLLVRDLKTGKSHPRRGDESEPTPGLDAQIALYSIVAQQLAPDWKLPSRASAAYVYPEGRGEHERSFRDDLSALEIQARHWLTLGARLMRERKFVRTPEADDCRYCPFRPVCGDAGPARSRELLAGEGGVLADFRVLKLGAATEKG
jgi:hypothetical protein